MEAPQCGRARAANVREMLSAAGLNSAAQGAAVDSGKLPRRCLRKARTSPSAAELNC